MSTFSELLNKDDGWVDVETNGKPFTVEISHSGYDAFIIISDTEPTAGMFGHRVSKHQEFIVKNPLTETAWISTDAPDDVLYIVSMGD